MAYRNKTYVCFASEDIDYYNMMTAWNENEHIDFNFHDAHDIAIVLDTSLPTTIRRRLRERLANTKQAVLLVGDKTRSKAGDSDKFLYYEMDVLLDLQLPIIIANVNQSREVQTSRMPRVLETAYTVSTSFRAKIIKYALDDWPDDFNANLKAASPKSGPYRYKDSVYKNLGL